MYASEQMNGQLRSQTVGVAGGFIGGADAAMRQLAEKVSKPELAIQLDRLEQALAFAHESVDKLRDRLDNGCMRPDAPATSGEAKLASASPSSGYAGTVYSMVDRTAMLSDKVLNLLRRLEV